MGMEYLDENGLARYDGLIKNWVTFKSGTVDGVDPLLNWQKTETAASVTCSPLPAAPLEPTVTFQFTETPPADGQPKSPTNPSTITGVSSITVTRCETVGVDSTDYVIDLNDTYYGGSLDVSAGTMTVTHEGVVIPRINIENASGTGFSGVFNLLVYDLRTGGKQANVFSYNESSGYNSSNYFCNYYPWERSGSVANTFHVSSNFAFLSIPGSSVENARQNLLSVYDAAVASGNPISFVYPLATPYIVQLSPTQVYSLSQPDPYTPRLNTVYSDQTSVQVGYPKSPLATASELTNAIISLGGNV